jgi:hypothetical protein
MTVHVDKSRRHNQSSAVDDLSFVWGRDLAANAGYRAVGDEHIADLVQALRWIQKRSAPK